MLDGKVDPLYRNQKNLSCSCNKSNETRKKDDWRKKKCKYKNAQAFRKDAYQTKRSKQLNIIVESFPTDYMHIFIYL